jgi:dTDP-4-dehydrorhamnose reductase
VKVIVSSVCFTSLRIAEERYSMSFAVIGDRGMFGTEMVHYLETQNREVAGFSRDSMDLNSPIAQLATQLDGFDVIINAVAYTAVDKAESELGLANIVNGEYAGKLAQAARSVGAKFMHISTDYVFDGSANTPYPTSATTKPQSAYGSSKLLGETLIAESGANYTIFRTAWLYGKHGRCFPKVMFEKASKKEPLRVVNDQYGQPTWTKDLAQQVLAFAELDDAPEIVHAVSSGKTTWFEFAQEIVGYYLIEPVSSSEFVTAAKRPSYSILDNSSDLVTPIGDWRERWQVAKSEVLERS